MTCPIACAVEQLDEENTAAWLLYQRLASRIVQEAQLGSEVLRLGLQGLDADAQQDTVDRLGIIHEIVSPPKVTRESD